MSLTLTHVSYILSIARHVEDISHTHACVRLPVVLQICTMVEKTSKPCTHEAHIIDVVNDGKAYL